jgi:hypothetical protein
MLLTVYGYPAPVFIPRPPSPEVIEGSDTHDPPYPSSPKPATNQPEISETVIEGVDVYNKPQARFVHSKRPFQFIYLTHLMS